jgi:hypothetical protein
MEAGRALGMAPSTVRRWIQTGGIAADKISSNGGHPRYRVTTAAVDGIIHWRREHSQDAHLWRLRQAAEAKAASGGAKLSAHERRSLTHPRFERSALTCCKG